MRTLRIGLTGGIGSGKSSVAAIFAEAGVPVLDLDQVGREVVQPEAPALRELVAAFDDAILNDDGTLNRAALAACCFKSEQNTARLNAIMHPRIRDAEQAWFAAQQAPFVIIEASVLIESGGADRMDAVIVVLANTELRRARVLARGDRNSEAFDAIVKRQCSDEVRRQVADYLIVNEGSVFELREQAESLMQVLAERSGRASGHAFPGTKTS